MATPCKDNHDLIGRLVAEGRSGRQIADQLGTGQGNVNRYIKRHFRGSTTAPQPRSVGAPLLPEEGQVSREEILKSQNDELRRRLLRDRRAEVAEERIVQAVEHALSAVTDPGLFLELPVYDAPAPSEDAHHRQVLLLSDFHGGEVVDPATINGLNAYSWEIMEGRVDELVKSVLKWKTRSPELTGLDVLFIGDMCSGINHQEIAETNEIGLAEQAVRMGYLQASILERLAPHYPELRVGGVEGNHPRLTSKPAAKRPHENGDWIANVIAREATQHLPNLTKYDIGQGSLFWEIAGKTAYVFHGDGIKSTMPGVPWGGVMRRADQLQRTYMSRGIDYFWFGHFHQPNIIQGGRIVGNGALKGDDEWTVKNFGGGSRPCQLLLEFDEDRERLTVPRFITPGFGLPE